MTEAEAIAKRIESFGAGRAFTAADFSDVAGRRNVPTKHHSRQQKTF